MASTVDQVTLRRRGVGLIACDPDRSAGGYTLIAPQTDGGRVELIDLMGTVVHSWRMPQRPGRHAVLLPNGNLGYNGNHPDSPNLYAAWAMWHGGAFAEVTPAGEVVWEHTDLTHHHDAQWLANGHLLYCALEEMPGRIAARVQGGSDRHDPPDGKRYSDVIREVDRSGAIVWEWRAADHLAPEDFPIHPFFDRYHWPMINGVFDASNGLVLLSLRTTSGVIAVRRDTGAVDWVIPHPIVSQQHSPVELDNGHILVFDNGNFRPGSSTPFSRIVEVDPKSMQVVWQYADPNRPAFFSSFMGGAQRLWNGNTMITESALGRLFEVTPEGDVVWEYVIPHFAEYPEDAARSYVGGEQNTVCRTYRYSKSQIPWL